MPVFELDCNDSDYAEGMSALPPDDEAALFQAVMLILKSGGWGQVVLVFKNGKVEDLNTTVYNRLSLKRRP